MSIFYVFQGETYKHERNGQYVWSPQRNREGKKNAGYTNMTRIKKDDFILHNQNGKIVAISIAQIDCYEDQQPKELSQALTTVQWNNDGYRVDTKYFEFEKPVKTTEYKEWLSQNYDKNSAFTLGGTGKQQYMCSLAYKHAIFFIEKAISMQNNEEVLMNLRNALFDIREEYVSEYDKSEVEAINDTINIKSIEELEQGKEWPGIKRKQKTTISNKTERIIAKRDAQIAIDALAHAKFKCEFNGSDKTFMRKNGAAYTEPHHLIPISRYNEFEYSVDAMENIISLCSHCHNLLHYGRLDDKKEILEKLFLDRKEALKGIGLEITYEQLLSYYR